MSTLMPRNSSPDTAALATTPRLGWESRHDWLFVGSTSHCSASDESVPRPNGSRQHWFSRVCGTYICAAPEIRPTNHVDLRRRQIYSIWRISKDDLERGLRGLRGGLFGSFKHHPRGRP